MANGSNAALRLVPASTVTVADEPRAPFDEHLGEAQPWVDAIVTALLGMRTQAATELQSGTGRLSEQTRAQGGDLLTRLYVIQSRIGVREFAATVRRAPGLDAVLVGVVLGVVDDIAVAARAMN